MQKDNMEKRSFNKERRDFKRDFKDKESKFRKDHPSGFKERESKFDKYKKDDSRKDNYKKKRFDDEVVEKVDKVYYTDNPDLIYDEGVKVRLEFTTLSHDARGIAKINGVSRKGLELVNYPIFVNGVLPGEKANVEITSYFFIPLHSL